jgi:Family of unknown function (DUF6650)
MKFSEIGQRINGIGISTPIFGFSVNWNPPEPAKNIAREVIIFLENRRVLYNACHLEDYTHCMLSANEMRNFLTDRITKAPSDDLERHLRAMRSACIKFVQLLVQHPHTNQFLGQGLGELRATLGLHIGILAAQYGIDIEDDLATIIPSADGSE